MHDSQMHMNSLHAERNAIMKIRCSRGSIFRPCVALARSCTQTQVVSHVHFSLGTLPEPELSSITGTLSAG